MTGDTSEKSIIIRLEEIENRAFKINAARMDKIEEKIARILKLLKESNE